MTYTKLKRLYRYQKERFPVVILSLSFLPAILSSGVIVSSSPTAYRVGLVLFASLAYLFHIRIIDEQRDFDHDNVHHKTRALQLGMISKKELGYANYVSLAIFLACASIAGKIALLVAIGALFYSYMASREFFVKEKIIRRFFLYNAANLVQMLLLQIFVYSVFTSSIPFNYLVVAHFLFTTVGTLIFEFVRKLKIPGDDGTGKDTYTWHLGFDNAMIVYSLLVLVNTVTFYILGAMLVSNLYNLIILTLFASAVAIISIITHWKNKTRKTDQLMQASFLALYIIYNLTIYYVAR